MSFDLERIYRLLPAHHRVLDARRGEPLKDFLAVIAEQIGATEADLEQLYDDLFIETCADWVVPYIGELVGVRGLVSVPGARFDPRALVANTIQYRRRKGTAAVLEQLARDTTGWRSSVVESFDRLVTTQYMNHLRPHNVAVTGVRHVEFSGLRPPGPVARGSARSHDAWAALERMGTPFDLAPRTAEVRRIGSRRGRWNIPNVGIFLWRLDSHPLEDVRPYALDARRFTFDPLGREVQLHNRVESEDGITHLAGPENVPHALERAELARELERHWGTSLAVVADGAPVDVGDVAVCWLGDVHDAGGSVVGWANLPTDRVAVDPVLGRFAFPSSQPAPTEVVVSFHHGFAAEMGGGLYARDGGFSAAPDAVVAAVGEAGPTLQDALDAVRGGLAPAGAPTLGIVEIRDSDTRVETPAIDVPARTPVGATIELRAADEERPLLVTDDIEIVGGENGVAVLDGLLIRGSVFVREDLASGGPNELRTLRIRHCTLSPDPGPAFDGAPAEAGVAPRLVVDAPGVRVEVESSILGQIRAVEGAEVRITDSIVDAGSPRAMAYAAPDGFSHGAPLQMENVTIVGRVRTRIFREASNTIFHALPTAAGDPPVEAGRLQQGCVRYSFVPPGSRVPRRYGCHPADAAEALRVMPVFTTLRFGAAGYGQLGVGCPSEILTGADDGAEMGAFHDLFQAQRAAALDERLDEYLRFGLEAGVFHGT